MRIICEGLFQREHRHMTKLSIPLYKHSTNGYHLNILRIIAIVYHLYIESGLYNLAYAKVKVGPIKWNF